jgi:hypothetical protein
MTGPLPLVTWLMILVVAGILLHWVTDDGDDY